MKTKNTIWTILLSLTMITVNAQLRVLSNGNAGIKETTPLETLHIGPGGAGGQVLRIGSYTSLGEAYSSGATVLGDNTTLSKSVSNRMDIMTTHGSAGARALRMSSSEGLTFHAVTGSVTAGNAFSNELFRITNAGYVGIGCSPSSPLEVRAGNIWNGTIRANSINTSDYSSFALLSNNVLRWAIYNHPGNSNNLYFANASGVDKIAITQSGNVGIGVVNPSSLMQLELSTQYAAKASTSTWWTTSDIGTKTNVQSYINGLDMVRQVKLVSYEYNGVAQTPIGEKGIGVIAQDFQTIFPNSVKQLTSADETGTSYLSINLHELFIANVAAVQQLDKIVSTQDSVITELLKIITNCCTSNNPELKKINNNIPVEPDNQTGTNINENNKAPFSMAILYQNNPNPFNSQTSIKYFIPSTAQSSSIMVFDLQGKLVKTFVINSYEQGFITINGYELNPGMFVYSLIVDGRIIDTKNMILTQ